MVWRLRRPRDRWPDAATAIGLYDFFRLPGAAGIETEHTAADTMSPPAVGRKRYAQLHPRRAASIAATSIFLMPLIASNARFASSPPAASASVSTRGMICQDTPHLSLSSRTHSRGRHCRRWRSRAVSLLLVISGDLEREGFVVLERGTAVETNTGDADDREFHCEHVARLAGRVIARGTTDGSHRAIRKCLGIEAGSSFGVPVVP